MLSIMKKKDLKEKKVCVKKFLSVKVKVLKKLKVILKEEVERFLKIVSMFLEKEEVLYFEDERFLDDDYIKSLKVDFIVVDKEDDGFEVDKGDEGVVKVKDVKVMKSGEVKVEVFDFWEKRFKVVNSLRFL